MEKSEWMQCNKCVEQVDSLEQYLIRHCSPTLASLKTANLFSCSYQDEKDFAQRLEYWNGQMNSKGICLTVLQKKGNWALVYVYRPSFLRRDLQRPGVAEFLENFGYNSLEIPEVLDHLRIRISARDVFPHEIGIFLNYPLEDVIGFIENRGCNCKCSGCWKVYQNEQNALATFARYKKCTRIYTDLWSQGRSIHQLTVSA